MTMGSLPARLSWLWRHKGIFANREVGADPRLLVDVSAIIKHDAQTGIQRVVRAVWSELRTRHGEGFDVVPVFATAQRGYCHAPLDFLHEAADLSCREPVRAGPSDRFLGLDFAAQFIPKYRAQLRAWRAAGASVHLIIYDLLPLIRPEWFTSAAVAHYRRWFDVVVRDADQAICISRQVARDLRDQLDIHAPVRRPEIAYLGMGGDIAASFPSTGVGEKVSKLLDRMRFRPTILMVGTIEPRKGYDAALTAFEHLWTTGGSETPDLVIVGKPGWKTAKLQHRIANHPELGTRLHWLDDVSDEGLCRLYDAARGVLMASRGEGFGLPLLEAVLHQRFVLARDLPVFREQGLPNVVYFDDDRREPLARSILQLTALGQTKASLTAKLPTWRTNVNALLVDLGLTPAETEFLRSPVCGGA